MSVVWLTVDMRPMDNGAAWQYDIIKAELPKQPENDPVLNSRMEPREFIRIAVEDVRLFDRLRKIAGTGEPYPKIIYPYCVWERDPLSVDGNTRLVTRSKYRFRFDLFSPDTAALYGVDKRQMADRATLMRHVFCKRTLDPTGSCIDTPLSTNDLLLDETPRNG